MSTRDQRWVAARRAAARALHPDRGGDPDTFIAALAALDTTGGHRPGGHDVPLIVIVRHARWRWLLAAIRRAVGHLPGTARHYAHL